MQVGWLFYSLAGGERHTLRELRPLYGHNLFISAGRSPITGELMVVVSNCPDKGIEDYLHRWPIGVSRLRTLYLVGESPTEVKDSSFVAWEAPWRESKTVKPSDSIFRKGYVQYTRL